MSIGSQFLENFVLFIYSVFPFWELAVPSKLLFSCSTLHFYLFSLSIQWKTYQADVIDGNTRDSVAHPLEGVLLSFTLELFCMGSLRYLRLTSSVLRWRTDRSLILCTSVLSIKNLCILKWDCSWQVAGWNWKSRRSFTWRRFFLINQINCLPAGPINAGKKSILSVVSQTQENCDLRKIPPNLYWNFVPGLFWWKMDLSIGSIFSG